MGRNDWSAHSTDHTKPRTYLVLAGYLTYSVIVEVKESTISVPLVVMTLLTRRVCKVLNIYLLFQSIYVYFRLIDLFQSIPTMCVPVYYLTTQVSRPFDYVEPLRQIERLILFGLFRIFFFFLFA